MRSPSAYLAALDHERREVLRGGGTGLLAWLGACTAMALATPIHRLDDLGSIASTAGYVGWTFLVTASGVLVLPLSGQIEALGWISPLVAWTIVLACVFVMLLGAWLALALRVPALRRLTWWEHAALVLAWFASNLVVVMFHAGGSLRG